MTAQIASVFRHKKWTLQPAPRPNLIPTSLIPPTKIGLSGVAIFIIITTKTLDTSRKALLTERKVLELS
jgi:hypothetical protein